MDSYLLLDELNPGPVPVPPGDYAMWLPTAEEPWFMPSQTRHCIRRVYDAAVGVESYATAMILESVGAIEEAASRLTLPSSTTSFSVLGPRAQVLILSLSRKKGIRLHFHESAAPAYRRTILKRLARFLDQLSQLVKQSGVPLDEPGEVLPADWWSITERRVANIERGGEQVTSVGGILVAQ